jgi:hypothetical protein
MVMVVLGRRIPIVDVMAGLAGEDVQSRNRPGSRRDDRLATIGSRDTTDRVDTLDARPVLAIDEHVTVENVRAKILGEPLRSFATSQHNVVAGSLLVTGRETKSSIFRSSDGDHLVSPKLGPDIDDLFPRYGLKVASANVWRSQVVAQLRVTHARLILSVDDRSMSVLPQKERSAQSCWTVAHDQYHCHQCLLRDIP